MTLLVSITIVNYRSRDLLGRCLTSVRQQTYPSIEVIVVDNDSADGSLECLADYPGIRLIRNPSNRGFAAAQNQGMRVAKGDYLMPLNYDIELTPNYVTEMVRAMEGSPSTGIVAGKLLQMSLEGNRTNTIYSAGHMMPRDRFPVHRGAGEVDRGQYDYVCEVFGAPGAAPLYRREMLEEIAFRNQYFDETLFTWYEDVDVDWRSRRMGWKCVFAPRACAYHVGHPEGHAGDHFQVATTVRNRWLLILSNEDLGSLLRNGKDIVRYEFGLLRYVVTSGLISPYTRAILGFAKGTSSSLKKRFFTFRKARGKPMLHSTEDSTVHKITTSAA